MTDAKKKALDLAMAQIEKNFGKGSIMKMGDNKKLNVEVIPTGALSLDLALGVGGLPRGRVVEIYGPEGGGKTTVSLHAIAEAQRKGGTAAFIDAEHSMDPAYAKRLGVDIDNLLISQPDYGEQALEIVRSWRDHFEQSGVSGHDLDALAPSFARCLGSLPHFKAA